MRSTIALFFLLAVLPRPSVSQLSNISFTTDEGTWVSLDVAPNGLSLVFELLGDVYTLPSRGGTARPIISGTKIPMAKGRKTAKG